MNLIRRAGHRDCHCTQASKLALLSLLSFFVCFPCSAQGGIAASAATTVTPTSDGNYQYDYTITNTSTPVDTSPSLIIWAIPFFDNADNSFIGGEAGITAPTGWTSLFTPLTPSDPTSDALWSYLAADDPKNATYGAPGSAFENPPYALVFFIDPLAQPLASIAPGTSLGG